MLSKDRRNKDIILEYSKIKCYIGHSEYIILLSIKNTNSAPAKINQGQKKSASPQAIGSPAMGTRSRLAASPSSFAMGTKSKIKLPITLRLRLPYFVDSIF